MSMKILLAAALATSAALAAPTAEAARYWTSWVSEEGGSPLRFCGAWDEAAVGFGCSGNYCDNVRLLCETLPFGATLDGATDYLTPWFSEEHDDFVQVVFGGGYWYGEFDENYQICQYTDVAHGGYAGLVSGVRCKGSNCDSTSLECTQPVKPTANGNVKLSTANCQWTGMYSEEQGSIDFGYNRYIVGAKCFGSYCDNKQFLVCSLVDPG